MLLTDNIFKRNVRGKYKLDPSRIHHCGVTTTVVDPTLYGLDTGPFLVFSMPEKYFTHPFHEPGEKKRDDSVTK